MTAKLSVQNQNENRVLEFEEKYVISLLTPKCLAISVETIYKNLKCIILDLGYEYMIKQR